MTTAVVERPKVFEGFEVRAATEDANLGETIMLVSSGGGGKTTVAASASEVGPCVFFDAEGGTKAISDWPEIDVIDMVSWTKIKEMRDKLKTAKEIPWRTIVLDNLSEYIQLAVSDIFGGLEASGAGFDPRWGKVIGEVIGLVRDYRNIARSRGVNVIILAWDSKEKDETNRLITSISATPRLQELLPGIVDIIGYISPVQGRQDLRRISFEVSDRNVTKFRRNRSDVANTIPLSITYGVKNLPLGDVLKTLRERTPFPTDKYPTPRSA